MVPARFAAQIGPRNGVIHGFIPGGVGLVRHLDMSQVLHAEGPSPAGLYHPDPVTLLNTQAVAILPAGHENVIRGLCTHKRVSKLSMVRDCVNPPALASSQ